MKTRFELNTEQTVPDVTFTPTYITVNCISHK